MREALKASGEPIPAFYEGMDYKTYLEKARQFKGQFIIKPADSSGSRGIYLIDQSSKDSDLLSAYNYSKHYSRSGRIIIEEFMQGPEVSVETVSYNGKVEILAITDKLTTGSPRFVEMGHSQPSRLSNSIQEKIKEITVKANQSIGIDFGPSHTEIIVTSEGPKIVEIGARMGGDNITTHLVPLSTGVDMVSACINIALGERPDCKKLYTKGSAIRYLSVATGVIEDIKGIELAGNVEGVKEIYFNKSIGEQVEETLNSTSRIGYVISQGANANQAIEACNNAIAKIDINIEEDGVMK